MGKERDEAYTIIVASSMMAVLFGGLLAIKIEGLGKCKELF